MDILTSLADSNLDNDDISQTEDNVDQGVHVVGDVVKVVKEAKGMKDAFKVTRQERKDDNVIEETEIGEESVSWYLSKDGLQNTRRLFQQISAKEAENKGHCKLNFKPPPLQSWFLISSLGFFFGCIAGLSALIRHGNQSGHTFHIHQSRNYLAFRYVPTATGAVTVILWKAIVTSLVRMTPYISLAEQSEEGASRSHYLRATLGNIQSNHVLTSSIYSVAADGYWLLFSCMLAGRILLVIVPLKASFLQIVADGTIGWTIYVLPKVGYILITMHSILLLVTISMLVRLWDCNTGLKWDPRQE